jgi:hypothetical protein
MYALMNAKYAFLNANKRYICAIHAFFIALSMRQVSVSDLMRPRLTTAQAERASFEHVQNSGANFLANLDAPWRLKTTTNAGVAFASHTGR